MIASQNGNTKIANHLLEKGADPDLQRSNGITVLMVASMNGQTDIVSALLNKGANPFLKTGEDKTALDYAGNDDIISLLENIAEKE